jgi:hypothetical protein
MRTTKGDFAMNSRYTTTRIARAGAASIGIAAAVFLFGVIVDARAGGFDRADAAGTRVALFCDD